MVGLKREFKLRRYRLPPELANSSRPPHACKVCTTGKACGITWISRTKTCHTPPGSACSEQ